jgi:hypothetical protein
MRRKTRTMLGTVLGLGLVASAVGAQQLATFKAKPPELTGVTEWINSKPLTLEGLKGKVVVLHFWTFG